MIDGADAPGDILHTIERAAWARGYRDALRDVLSASFDVAWQKFVDAGYRYGDDALEQVRMGFEICQGKRSPQERGVDRPMESDDDRR